MTMRKFILSILLFLSLACNFPINGPAPATSNPQEIQSASPEITIPPMIDPATSTPQAIVPIPESEIPDRRRAVSGLPGSR